MVSSVAPGSVPNSQPFLPRSATVTETEITLSSFFQFAENQSAVRPRAGERNVQMIAVSFGGKAAFAGWPGTAVGRDVIVECRRFADETTVLDAHIYILPGAVDEQTHCSLRLKSLARM